MTFLIITLSTVFAALGSIHLYWAAGGRWGFGNTLPIDEQGEKTLKPGAAACTVVGLGLLAFGLFYLFKLPSVPNPLPDWLNRYGGWFIVAVFTLRAGGDFKYVGFFKKVKQTPFGRMDTGFYSPLCLGIGLVALFLEVVK